MELNMENSSINPSKPDQGGTDMEPLNEFDQNHFYETDHIDKEVLAERDRSAEDLTYQEISGTASIADRMAEEELAKHVEPHEISENMDVPTAEDGKKLMDVGRAPDS